MSDIWDDPLSCIFPKSHSNLFPDQMNHPLQADDFKTDDISKFVPALAMRCARAQWRV